MAQMRHQLPGNVAQRARVLMAILMLVVMGLFVSMCHGHGVLHLGQSLGPRIGCPFPHLQKPIAPGLQPS